MKQSEEALKWAGDNWYKRNKKQLGGKDLVGELLDKVDLIKPSDAVLEIGCSNGWRLKKLRDKYGCYVAGVEPSQIACAEAWSDNKIAVTQGVAASLPHEDEFFDIVIMGFCMWLTEPKEWLRNVSESDRVLKDGGHLIIQDFLLPRPVRRRYARDQELIDHGGLYEYFFDWPKLWLVHPGYRTIHESIWPEYEAVTVLRKNMAGAVGDDVTK